MFLSSLVLALASLRQVSAVGCDDSPCQNGCTCQPSCQDENDYVCLPPAGRVLVGKNCEWEGAVTCSADRVINLAIPAPAVAQYAKGVNNVIVQGCNPPLGTRANQYICETPTCGPARLGNGVFTLSCQNNLFETRNGEFFFSQTFVFDRDSKIIRMPRPIVRIECGMQTRPAIASITPQIRDPNTKQIKIFWTPNINFYKTAWGNPAMIPVNNGGRLDDGSVGYIIGEKIHVRINANLNGVQGSNLPNSYGFKHAISLKSCSISPGGKAGQTINIIGNGKVSAGLPFPVSVDNENGLLGGGIPINAEGVAFSFQVFTYGSGSSLQLTCTVDITESRTRRSAQNETEEVIVIKEATAKILIFEPAEENTDEDIPNISMIQDPKHIYIEKAAKALSPAQLLEDDLEDFDGPSAALVGVLFAGLAFTVIIILGLAVKKRIVPVLGENHIPLLK